MTRIKLILQRINQDGKITVNQLAECFHVSVETIRRDLTVLQQKGLIYRVHGAALSLKTKDMGSSFQARCRSNYNQKHNIAQKALDYLFENAVIGLDASSSSWHFAELMPDIVCTVITNSMRNIKALVNKPNIKTIATGGVYSGKYDAFYGPLSEHLLQRLQIDIGIFSCSAVDCDGIIWESNELNASVKRRIMSRCEQKFLLADQSKFGQKSLIQLGELSQMDVIFTDPLPNDWLQNYCAEHDILINA